jgi:Flp pilus assembly pilin Flp
MSNYRELASWVRASLGVRTARLRTALREGDRGASAVELAVITAVILGIAITLLLVITNFVKDRGTQITNAPVPNGP